MESLDPEALRARLFEAVHTGDRDLLWRLCLGHREVVVNHFPDWRRVPLEARGEPAALERYASGLLGVAACFAERLGDPALLEALTGADAPDQNPLVGWERALVDALELANELRYPEAIALLSDTLIDTRGLRGSGVDHYLPRTFGILGDCYFQAGRARESLRPSRNALEASERLGDDAGVRTYLGRLYEAHRYLGEGADAAGYAERLAAALTDDAANARWYRAQARRLREGEPLCRVALEVEGARVELDEVERGLAGPFRFVYVRNRPPLQPARVWTQRAEGAGREGKIDEALGSFQRAAEADPYDPHPHYQAGTLALFAERYYVAVEELGRAEELAPGWFEVRTRLRLAQELAAGAIPLKVVEVARDLERAELEPQEALAKVTGAREDAPEHPLLLLHHGRALARLGRGAEARARYLEALERAEGDVALETRIHLELALASASPGREEHLGRAAELGEHLVAAATARLLLGRG
ncbi:MAG: tetratricopeptide repeat protein [Planctomycetota bacterium]